MENTREEAERESRGTVERQRSRQRVTHGRVIEPRSRIKARAKKEPRDHYNSAIRPLSELHKNRESVRTASKGPSERQVSEKSATKEPVRATR